MKKFTLLCYCCAIALGLSAQQPYQGNLDLSSNKVANRKVNDLKSDHNIINSNRAPVSLVLDYDGADQNFANAQGDTYTRYAWGLNGRFQQADDLTVNWALVTFDQLVDGSSGLPFTTYPTASSTVKLDSFIVFLGHWNPNGNNDVLTATVIESSRDVNGNVSTGNVLWADTSTFNFSLSSGLNVNNIPITTALTYYPNGGNGIQLAQGESFAVRIDFDGDTTLPSQFNLLAGFRDECNGTCAGEESIVTDNSFYFGNHGTFSGVNTVYRECVADQQITPGACEYWYIQNWVIVAFVTVEVPLDVQVSGAPTGAICPGDVVTVTANATGGTGPLTYSWTPTTGLSNPSSATTNITAGTNDITYTVIVTDGNGATASETVNIDVDAITVNAGADQVLNCGGTANLLATVNGVTTGASFLWSNGVTTLNNDNLSPGTYSITANNASGCSSTDAVNVTLAQLNQNVSFSAVTQACEDSTISFTNTSSNTNGWSWTWSFGDGFSSFTLNTFHIYTNTGTFTVTLTGDSSGCSLSSTQNITIQNCSPPQGCNPPSNLQPGISPEPNQVACITQGVPYNETVYFKNFNQVGVVTIQSLTIDSITNLPCGITWQADKNPPTYLADSSGCITFLGTSNSPAGQYNLDLWVTIFVAGTPISGNANDLAMQFGVPYTPPILRVKTAVNPCVTADTSSAGLTASCGGNPSLGVTVAAGNNPICPGGSTVLTASASGGSGNYTYSWSPSTGLNSTTSATPTASPSSTTTYTVVVNDGVTSSSASVTLVVATPSASAGSDQTICGSNSVQLSASGGVQYNWSPGTGLSCTNCANPFASPSTTISYQVTVTDANGCTATDDVLVTVAGQVVASAGSDQTICSGGQVQLNATGGIQYTWSPSVGLSCSNCADPIASPTTSTTYQVTVTDANGCTGTDDVIITISNTVVPTVSIVSDPAPACQGVQLVFTATASGGGSPTYQWKLNGNNVGTNNSTYTANSLQTGDVVSCDMTSSLSCATPSSVSSNPITIDACVGIEDVLIAENISLYPNPAEGFTTLEIRNAGAGEILLELYDLNGSLVISKSLIGQQNLTEVLDLTSISRGIYVLKLQQEKSLIVQKLVKQ